jgi:hypothetical protein
LRWRIYLGCPGGSVERFGDGRGEEMYWPAALWEKGMKEDWSIARSGMVMVVW